MVDVLVQGKLLPLRRVGMVAESAELVLLIIPEYLTNRAEIQQWTAAFLLRRQ